MKYLNILVKQGYRADANYINNTEYAALAIADFVEKFGKAGEIEKANSGTCYFTIWPKSEKEENIQVRISDHTKPFFGEVEKYNGAGYVFFDDQNAAEAYGLRAAKKVLKIWGVK